MASIYFCSSKQFVRPPQRGIFPLRRSRYWMQAIHHTWRYSCIVTFRFDVSFHIIIIHTHAFSCLIVFCVEQKVYLDCHKGEKQQHNKCREFSKEYLLCRMDSQLMAKEDLNEVRFFCARTVLYILIIILLNPREWNWPCVYSTVHTRTQRKVIFRLLPSTTSEWVYKHKIMKKIRYGLSPLRNRTCVQFRA